MKEPSRIEILESRIAPASVSVTYTDIDGDLVKITASKLGALPPLNAADLIFTDADPDGQLKELTLTDTGFDGASITFTVTKKPGGDGLTHVGYINASGVDLDKVVVKGDLGRIDAGNLPSNDPGLNLLRVRTMGTLGLSTQGLAGDLGSRIYGKLGALKVAGDFTDADIEADQIGLVFIGGDLTGGAGAKSGSIRSVGSMGDVRIGGNVTGGAGESSGTITSGLITGGTITSVGSMGDVRIGGNLIGAGKFSGQLGSTGGMDDVTIGGSVIGGDQPGSGQVVSVKGMGHVRIGGNLIGGSIAGDASLSDSGEVISFGLIRSVTIGGSLIAGSDASTGTLLRCGAIVAGDELGPVKIGGSILGNVANPALVIAKGWDLKQPIPFDIAIASLTVGGDVRFARILAGFDMDQAPFNADASIGKVTVGADWVASSLLAGAEETGLPTGYKLQTASNNTFLVARIASIVIKGDVTGSLAMGDQFGFVAQRIDKLKIGSRIFALTAGPGTDQHLFSDDDRLSELS